MASSTLSAVGNHLVFLSFCGKDTRQGFISHLYDALCAERVKIFIDNDLPKGDRIDKIFEVIKEAKIHIVVYSENYSSSKWCLDELAEIMKCLKCSNDGECHVLPVFYKVNPSSDIRGANSITDYHLRRHELELGKNSMMVAIWKAALLDLSRIAGWHFETGAESKLVKDVVRRVLSLLQKGSKHFFSLFEEIWNRKTFDLKNTLNFIQPTITRVSSTKTTTYGGRKGVPNKDLMKEGDLCGEELLPWALDPNSSPHHLPTSARTLYTVTQLEAFGLEAEDFKFVASQFSRRLHSKQLQHTFRYHSQQWKIWGACCIQVAWWNYIKRKKEIALYEALKNTERWSPFGSILLLLADFKCASF